MLNFLKDQSYARFSSSFVLLISPWTVTSILTMEVTSYLEVTHQFQSPSLNYRHTCPALPGPFFEMSLRHVKFNVSTTKLVIVDFRCGPSCRDVHSTALFNLNSEGETVIKIVIFKHSFKISFHNRYLI